MASLEPLAKRLQGSCLCAGSQAMLVIHLLWPVMHQLLSTFMWSCAQTHDCRMLHCRVPGSPCSKCAWVCEGVERRLRLGRIRVGYR